MIQCKSVVLLQEHEFRMLQILGATSLKSSSLLDASNCALKVFSLFRLNFSVYVICCALQGFKVAVKNSVTVFKLAETSCYMCVYK